MVANAYTYTALELAAAPAQISQVKMAVTVMVRLASLAPVRAKDCLKPKSNSAPIGLGWAGPACG